MVRRRHDQDELPGLAPVAVDRPPARVRLGVQRQLAAQRRLGQIEPVDAGLVALARTLAESIDAVVVDPDGSLFTVGALAARLHPILAELRGDRVDRATDQGVDVELAALVAALRDAPEPGPPDPR